MSPRQVATYTEVDPEEPGSGNPAPLFNYRDAHGNCWIFTKTDAARRPGLVLLDDEPVQVGTPRPRATYDLTGFDGARQVADGTGL